MSQRRSAWSLPSFFKSSRGADPSHSATGGQNLDDPAVRKRLVEQQQAAPPSMSDSIFEEEVQEATKGERQTAGPQRRENLDESAKWVTDPDPRARVRWERKRVIQMVRKQTAAEEVSDFDKRAARILRSERQMTHRSPALETSMKKLVHLARQIQGKTLADAMLQMTYSKKKMATEVKYHLELARDMAIVSRGMGLGKAGASAEQGPVIKIKTKDGKSHKVSDPSSLYIAEAWVNKDKARAKRMEIKGRGRSGLIVSPSTSISIVLKEEKTRIREHNERVAKEAKRKPWVHLPNRPVTAQRPYYSW